MAEANKRCIIYLLGNESSDIEPETNCGLTMRLTETVRGCLRFPERDLSDATQGLATLEHRWTNFTCTTCHNVRLVWIDFCCFLAVALPARGNDALPSSDALLLAEPSFHLPILNFLRTSLLLSAESQIPPMVFPFPDSLFSSDLSFSFLIPSSPPNFFLLFRFPPLR